MCDATVCITPTQPTNNLKSLFHEGEREAQERAGTTGVANELSRSIKAGGVHQDSLPFLSSCQFVGVSTVDSTNRVWASSFYVPSGIHSLMIQSVQNIFNIEALIRTIHRR